MHKLFHEVGHNVYEDVHPEVRHSWIGLHQQYGYAINYHNPQYHTDWHEAFADTYAIHKEGKDLPDEVEFFFDQSDAWRRRSLGGRAPR
jgi:hypothetical protein